MIRNLAASVRARLKQQADAAKEDFNLTLTRYGLERLLYRLSISPYAGNYLLKGALLFSLWYDHPHRPTRDADLLGFGPDDVGMVLKLTPFHGRLTVLNEEPEMPTSRPTRRSFVNRSSSWRAPAGHQPNCRVSSARARRALPTGSRRTRVIAASH